MRDRERAHEWGRDRKRQRERIPSRICVISAEPDVGLELTNCEIMTRVEVGRLTDRATQAPRNVIFTFKKNDILQYVTTWTNLEHIVRSEIRQSQKEIHGSTSVRYLK